MQGKWKIVRLIWSIGTIRIVLRDVWFFTISSQTNQIAIYTILDSFVDAYNKKAFRAGKKKIVHKIWSLRALYKQSHWEEDRSDF